MRVIVSCLLVLLPIAGQAADELEGLAGDSEKAVYCLYTNTVSMQLQGALMTDASKASEMMRTAGRWQTVIGGAGR
ncbi:hypothetical protein [Congregibacter litoralis]|uniref:Uncharacterized protein n=1 Tax=Congregibacter litoralis KT71 TaxID=314285 RepID=A4A4L0_9GAMM|nr:hypothetical protein [Congregibacter litoralis]EAQ98731.1 hypothetical protein KT71_08897 [Congregibacter litoralis KT71]